MIQQFETIQKASKENVDAALKAFGATSKGVQALAVEATDYAKKSFEAGTATIEKLAGVKTLDKAIEIQSDYVKTAFEGYVAQVTKIASSMPRSPRTPTSRSRASSPRPSRPGQVILAGG